MPLIAVLRAETFYLPPPDLPPDAWDLVPPAERVLRWWEARSQQRIDAPPDVIAGQTPYARIDANRWVADCPCGSAQVVTPTDQRMTCVECGAGWYQLLFPPDPAAAEAAVDALLPADRFWWNPADPSTWQLQPVPDVAPADTGGTPT